MGDLFFVLMSILLTHHKIMGNTDISWWVVFIPIGILLFAALIKAIGE